MSKHFGFVKCERCSEKEGRDVYFFSRKYAEHGVKPIQCPKCKRLDYAKVKKK